MSFEISLQDDSDNETPTETSSVSQTTIPVETNPETK